MGMPELMLIFVVALLVFGPKKLPEIGKSLGRAMHEFKRATNEFKDNLENEVGTAEIKEDLLKQQKEIQTSLAAATSLEDKPKVEEAPSATKEESKTSHA